MRMQGLSAGTGTAPELAGDSLGTGVTQLSHSRTTLHYRGHTEGPQGSGVGQPGCHWSLIQHRLAMDTELLRGQTDTAHTQCQHR